MKIYAVKNLSNENWIQWVGGLGLYVHTSELNTRCFISEQEKEALKTSRFKEQIGAPVRFVAFKVTRA